jgi:hypothetical protein
MAERALRGSNLGSTSYENEKGVEFAPRLLINYDCPKGHVTTVPFATEADIPATWECRSCGATALLRDGEEPEARATRPQRTHWDMLLERRSVDDLEEVLAERLASLREQGGVRRATTADHRKDPRYGVARKSA